jgi:hypothetical protein
MKVKMRYPLFLAAIGLSLAACSEKPQEKAVAPPAPGFERASSVRPAVIQNTQNLPTGCALDSVNEQLANGETSLSDKTKLRLSGWIGNVPAGTSPKQVFVEFDGPGKAYVQATPGGKRPDVADHFKKASLVDTGWVVNADLAETAAGTYKVRIIQVEGQTGLVCDSNKSIVIK